MENNNDVLVSGVADTVTKSDYNETEKQVIGIRKSLIEANDYLTQAGALLQEQGESEFFHALVKANAKLVGLDANLKERILNGSFRTTVDEPAAADSVIGNNNG